MFYAVTAAKIHDTSSFDGDHQNHTFTSSYCENIIILQLQWMYEIALQLTIASGCIDCNHNYNISLRVINIKNSNFCVFKL